MVNKVKDSKGYSRDLSKVLRKELRKYDTFEVEGAHYATEAFHKIVKEHDRMSK